MMPAAILTWMYGWYFLWRHLVTPKPSASDSLDRLITKARAIPGMVFLQSIAFFYRSYLEWKGGPEAEGKYLDKDKLGDDVAEAAAEIH